MALIYEDKVHDNKSAFISKVIDISNTLGIDANWLMAVINFESAGTFSPSVKNPSSGATGLIQFIPSTALGLGTTVDSLASMSNVNQLDYVLKYYNTYKSKIISYVDLYLATLFPKALGKPDNYILQTDTISAGSIAKNNPVFDLNKNNEITVGEVKQQKLNEIPDSWKSVFLTTKDNVVKFTSRNLKVIALIIVLLFVLLIYLLINRNK